MTDTPRKPPTVRAGERPSHSGRFARLQPIRRRLRRIADATPLTVRGAMLISLAALALWLYGFGSLDLLLFVVGVSGLALFATAAALVSGAALHLSKLTRTSSGEHPSFECGSLIRTEFKLPALAWCPLVQTSWSWADPRDVRVHPRLLGSFLYEEVIGQRRALRPALERRFEVRDPFGLSCVAWQATEPAEVMLLPDVGRLRQSSMIPSLSAADGSPNPSGSPEGDRMEIRPYVPGDSVRNIIWSWYAKTRQLVVRTRERSIDRSRRVVAYLIASEDDEAAAAAARVALEQGALGDRWSFGADGTSGFQDTVADAIRAIARSGSLDADVPCALRDFMRQVSAEGDVHCIVFASAAGGAWIQAALTVQREYPGGLSFVLGTDGITRTQREQLWQRLVLVESVEQGTPAESVGALVRLLSHAGSRVVIADRASGRYYAEGASQALGATA